MFYWQIYNLSAITASFAEINWFILRKFAENNAASGLWEGRTLLLAAEAGDLRYCCINKKLRHKSNFALLLCRSCYCELSLSMFLLHHLNHLAVLTANDVDALLHSLKLTTREVVDCAIGSVGAGCDAVDAYSTVELDCINGLA